MNTTADELPDTGTSLARVLGAPVDRGPLLLAFLRAVERRYRRWTAALGDPVASGLAAGLPGLVVDGRHRGGREPPRRLDARGDGAGGRLGRPAGGRDGERDRRARLGGRAARAAGVTAGGGRCPRVAREG